MSRTNVPIHEHEQVNIKYRMWKAHSLAIMEELTAIEKDRDTWKAKAESLAIRLRSMETDLKRLETEVGHG